MGNNFTTAWQVKLSSKFLIAASALRVTKGNPATRLLDFLTAGIDCLIKGTEAHQCALFLCCWMGLMHQKSGLPVCGWHPHTMCCLHGEDSFRNPGGSTPPKGSHSCTDSFGPPASYWSARALECASGSQSWPGHQTGGTCLARGP